MQPTAPAKGVHMDATAAVRSVLVHRALLLSDPAANTLADDDEEDQ